MMLAILTVNLALALGLAQAALPEDPRLDPVRARLEEMVNRTAAAGLPPELVVSKVREGLAKNVAPDRIAAAAARLTESLQSARRFVAERRPAAPPSTELVRALAEARLAGVELAAADAVIAGGRPASETARAVEVLTDLSLRGYPAGRAAVLVKELFARDAGSVGRLPATLETLRRDQALSHADTVDALARGLQGGGSLEQASVRAADHERGRKGPAPATRGSSGEPGRKEMVAPPGQLKKQMGMSPKGPPTDRPGRTPGRNPR